MKSRIRPVSRPVVFRDRAAGAAFLARSTADADERVTWEDGRSYPVIDVETSSASHPFYTGTKQVPDTAGRIERFDRRYGSQTPGS
ncbi:type B 50S ribosomal protein L31 [Streptomyces sp. NPDC056831]|uniref:type B 50S ribosomal protein L31 n=1 Tax=Streptomyces sp. NPDC056831 TaxID=3345954 RepID=UPI00367838C8